MGDHVEMLHDVLLPLCLWKLCGSLMTCGYPWHLTVYEGTGSWSRTLKLIEPHKDPASQMLVGNIKEKRIQRKPDLKELYFLLACCWLAQRRFLGALLTGVPSKSFSSSWLANKWERTGLKTAFIFFFWFVVGKRVHSLVNCDYLSCSASWSLREKRLWHRSQHWEAWRYNQRVGACSTRKPQSCYRMVTLGDLLTIYLTRQGRQMRDWETRWWGGINKLRKDNIY